MNHYKKTRYEGAKLAEGKSQLVCAFFKAGKCKFGDKCKYLHAKDTKESTSTTLAVVKPLAKIEKKNKNSLPA